MILTVAGLQFRYNGHRILQGIEFTVDKGQIVAVLGVNGAGKSTLLKCLNGILKPQGGSVFVEGVETRHLGRDCVARSLAYVPQRYSEEEGVSVFDAVLLGRKPHAKWSYSDTDMRIVDDVLHVMGLEHLALRTVNNLSGGEAQKVMIARALAQEPKVLLLDEPTSNLDLKSQLEVMTFLLSAVRDRDISLVVAMHDVAMALRFADLFLFLKDGSIHAAVGKKEITSEMIGSMYGVPVLLGEMDGYPFVIPLETRKEEAQIL